MEKITKELLIQFLNENKVNLKCSQLRICVPIVDRIYKKMISGIKFAGIKVENGIICDGHHRYLASLLANYSIEIIDYVVAKGSVIRDWSFVEFIEEDYDTQAKIDMWNRQDAEYNDLPLDKLVDLLK